MDKIIKFLLKDRRWLGIDLWNFFLIEFGCGEDWGGGELGLIILGYSYGLFKIFEIKLWLIELGFYLRIKDI
jgi:hypothetical protein